MCDCIWDEIKTFSLKSLFSVETYAIKMFTNWFSWMVNLIGINHVFGKEFTARIPVQSSSIYTPFCISSYISYIHAHGGK